MAASQGILIKSAEALEKAASLRAVVLDKTGTLTEGHPTVVACTPLDSQASWPGVHAGLAVLELAWRGAWTRLQGGTAVATVHAALRRCPFYSGPCLQWPLESVLYLAASAENGSEHPLAKAVLAYAAQRLEGCAAASAPPPAAAPATQQGQAAWPPAGGGGNGGGEGSEFAPQAPLLAAGPAGQPGSAWLAQQEAAAQQLRSVGWLAPITSSEALPGRGLKCWLAVPAERLPGTPPALLGTSLVWPGGPPGDAGLAPATPRAGEGADAAGAASQGISSAGGGSGGTVEVRLAIGNRRLMQEEGIAVGPQASAAAHGQCTPCRALHGSAAFQVGLAAWCHLCLHGSSSAPAAPPPGARVDAGARARGGHVRSGGGGAAPGRRLCHRRPAET